MAQKMPKQSTWNISPQPNQLTVSGVASRSYSTRKTVAQGMLDFALLMANASQLKALVTSSTVAHDAVYVVLLSLIGLSILLQILVGVIIVVLGSMDVHDEAAHIRANRLNNSTVGLILFITVINVFIAAFGGKVAPFPRRVAVIFVICIETGATVLHIYIAITFLSQKKDVKRIRNENSTGPRDTKISLETEPNEAVVDNARTHFQAGYLNKASEVTALRTLGFKCIDKTV